MTESFFAMVRALGFGGFLGAGVFGLLHVFIGSRIADLPFERWVLVGALLGGGCSHILGKFSALIASPVANFISHYEKRLELRLQVRARLLKPDTATYIENELAKRYFLGAETEKPVGRIGFQ